MVKQFRQGKGRYQDSRLPGTRPTDIFQLKGFQPKRLSYRNRSLQQCHVMDEQEKKGDYNERILQIDHGVFTPLVFSINGSMGRECQKFYSDLA